MGLFPKFTFVRRFFRRFFSSWRLLAQCCIFIIYVWLLCIILSILIDKANNLLTIRDILQDRPEEYFGLGLDDDYEETIQESNLMLHHETPRFKVQMKYEGVRQSEDNVILVNYSIPACSCFKESPSSYQDLQSLILSSNPTSTCSQEASLFGPGQNVVSFSLYVLNTNPNKTEIPRVGAEKLYRMLGINLEMIRKHYPAGWVLRVYTNAKLEGDYLCDLVCNNMDFFWCDITNIPKYGDLRAMFYMTWRFLALGDPTVDAFVSRDLDSYIINRDAAVVKDWMTLDKPFHLMRDKKAVHDTLMLGGMWGARNSLLERDEARNLLITLITRAKRKRDLHHRGFEIDQSLLRSLIYRYHRNLIVAYDSYHCKKYSRYTMVRPFPTRRLNESDIVGIPFGYPYKLEECPLACRPDYGKDWKFC